MAAVTMLTCLAASTGLHELRKWCVHGYHQIHHYDQRYSDWLAIPRSIKTTCVKPSGTVSLLAGGVLARTLWWLPVCACC